MSIFNFFNKYNKTNFDAGGLILDEVPLSAPKLIKSQNFMAPRKLDFRDMCLRSDDQGNTSMCAAFSTAGFVEILNWRTKNYPEQVDAPAIYNEAKRIDGNSREGTTLNSATQAAINLGFISGKGTYINNTIDDVKFAIHRHVSVIAGFKITEDWNYVEKNTGFIRMTEGSNVRGGHAVLICGFSEDGFYIQNSWGGGWGVYGFGILRFKQFSEQLMQAQVIVP